ncbi:MAG: hypothetical protein ACOH2R_01430 [Pseudomonas sp.]
MSVNPYATPQSALTDREGEPVFYVVSVFKLIAMSVLTLGCYNFYWWCKNWKLYNAASGRTIWPILRCVFTVFFAYSLFQKINSNIRQSSRRYIWMPKLRAIALILLTVFGYVSGDTYSLGEAFALSIALSVIHVYLWVGAQRAINFSENDPEGLSNSGFTLFNWLWILFGVGVWGLLYISFISLPWGQ